MGAIPGEILGCKFSRIFQADERRKILSMTTRFFHHGQRAYTRRYMLGLHRRAKGPDPRQPQVLLGSPCAFDFWEPWSGYASPQFSGVFAFGREIPIGSAREICVRMFDGMFPGVAAYLPKLVVLHRYPLMHAHWAIGRMNLLTGRRVDLFSGSADALRLDLQQESINFEYGLPSPKDPERARVQGVSMHGLTCPPAIRRQALITLEEIKHLAADGWIHLTDTEAVSAELLERAENAVVIATKSGAALKFELPDSTGKLALASAELVYHAHIRYNRGKHFATQLGFADYTRHPEFHRAIDERLAREVDEKRRDNEAHVDAARQRLGYPRSGTATHGIGATIPDVRVDPPAPARVAEIRENGGANGNATLTDGAEHPAADVLGKNGSVGNSLAGRDAVDTPARSVPGTTGGPIEWREVRADPPQVPDTAHPDTFAPIELTAPIIEIGDGVVIDNRPREVTYEH